MARIRTIKPEFLTAEQVMELSPMARALRDKTPEELEGRLHG